MPITRRQFDLGIDESVEEVTREIHRFLSSRRTQAFSRDELLAAILNQEPSARHVDSAIEKLVEIRAMDLREVRGERYYAYLEDLSKVW
jgi:hypothetical protein